MIDLAQLGRRLLIGNRMRDLATLILMKLEATTFQLSEGQVSLKMRYTFGADYTI